MRVSNRLHELDADNRQYAKRAARVVGADHLLVNACITRHLVVCISQVFTRP